MSDIPIPADVQAFLLRELTALGAEEVFFRASVPDYAKQPAVGVALHIGGEFWRNAVRAKMTPKTPEMWDRFARQAVDCLAFWINDRRAYVASNRAKVQG